MRWRNNVSCWLKSLVIYLFINALPHYRIITFHHYHIIALITLINQYFTWRSLRFLQSAVLQSFCYLGLPGGMHQL
jgi:hypothetical protein